MERELIVAFAQIATGLATLVVAMFLAGQLFLQRRALAIAHLDSVREQLFASEKRRDDIAFTAVSDESLAPLWVRGGEALSTLDDVGHYRFRTYLRAYFLWVRTDWALRRESDDVSSFETLLRTLLSAKGRRDQYAGDLRGNLLSEPELLEIADRIYEEFEGAPVSATTEGIAENLPANIPRSYGA
ncbi:uncharacterized protein METZ01_LOCUS407892 [marine metagenome]|uniref:DUF4760 domain-containing protein n=1 Tax=marine metagenome TaxID=408172 RepID=A0A382WA82_9ZZZZ